VLIGSNQRRHLSVTDMSLMSVCLSVCLSVTDVLSGSVDWFKSTSSSLSNGHVTDVWPGLTSTGKPVAGFCCLCSICYSLSVS